MNPDNQSEMVIWKGVYSRYRDAVKYWEQSKTRTFTLALRHYTDTFKGNLKKWMAGWPS